MQTNTSITKNTVHIPQTLNGSTHDLTIQLLGIKPKEMKQAYERDTCTPTFIVLHFTIAKIQNQPKCQSSDNWIKKLWHICTVDYQSSIKKNKILMFARLKDLNIL